MITAAAYFCSDIFLHFIEGRLHVSVSPRVSSQAKKAPKEDIPPESHYMSILERNLFDPSARKKKNELESPGQHTGIQPIPSDIKVISGRIALRGTVIPVLSDRTDRENPQEATDLRFQQEARAIIEDLSTRTQSLYSINQKIGDRKIVAIKKSEVILARPDGSLERLIIDSDRKSKAGAAPVGRRTTPPSPSASPMVEKISASSYALSRDEVMNVVQNMSQFMTQLRARPHFQNGKPSGFLLTNIKAGSLVGQLGIKNGDILKGINGQAITRPDELIQAYQQLQNEDMIQLEIERKGGRQTFTYTIHD